MEVFPSTRTFPDRVTAEKFCRDWVRDHQDGRVVTVRSTQRKKVGGKKVGDVYKVRMVCSRGGPTRSSLPPGAIPKRASTSNRMGCPFRIDMRAINEVWSAQIVNGVHSCPTPESDSKPAYARRQEREETLTIREIIIANQDAGISASTTFKALQKARPSLATIQRDVENIYATRRRELKASNHETV
jgi:hypothetical protein